jgi:hypothetical protein
VAIEDYFTEPNLNLFDAETRRRGREAVHRFFNFDHNYNALGCICFPPDECTCTNDERNSCAWCGKQEDDEVHNRG